MVVRIIKKELQCQLLNMFLFKPRKEEEKQKDDPKLNQDLAIITQMNQEFALSLDLDDTLKTALQVIIARINAQAANIFLIEDKKKVCLLYTSPSPRDRG